MKFFIKYYFITFWSVVLTWSFLLNTTNLTEIKGNLPDPQVLSRIINEFVKPMIKSFSSNNTLFRAHKESAVEKAVTERLSELREFLQDNDVNTFDKENDISGSNEKTAIIEFLPKTNRVDNRTKNSLKDNQNEYRKIRQKIKRALKKETISEKTKTLILKTLDGLIKKLLNSQCDWKRRRLEKTEEPYLIAKKWKEGWRNIKETISKFLASDPRRNSNIPKYIDNLHVILKRVSKDADLIAKKYKIQCELVPKVYHMINMQNPKNLRNNWDKTEMEDNRCKNVVVCSNELRAFMLNLYKSINDTTISVLKNYAEMYNKEVNTNDVEENKYINSLLANISCNLEGYISEVFIDETSKFKLHKQKNPDANIKLLSDYVKNNIKNVKDKIKKIVRTQIDNVREKLANVIRADIQVNLDVDLGNLEQEFLKRICTVFRLCNGGYVGRRQNTVLRNVDKNNLNVQVQLYFDDELPKYRRLYGSEILNITTKLMEYNSYVNVTRTTLTFNSTITSG